MAQKIINIGILGTANIARKAIIPALKESPDLFRILGVGSRDTDKGESFAEELRISFLGNYEEVLDTPGIQAVYIPLPNASHYPWIKKSIKKGIHVLSEKSLACTPEEVKELNALAQEKQLVLLENFQFRFHSQLKFIKDFIDSGKLGKIKNIKSFFGFPPFKDQDNIRYKKELGGGALLDVGAYPIKIAQYFLGSDIYVSDAVLEIDKEKGVDISGSAFIKKKNSPQTAFASFGFDHAYQCSVDIWGSRGRIYTNRIFTSPPGNQPEIHIDSTDGKETIQLEADNHYKNILHYFHHLITTGKGVSREYVQNKNQAELLHQLYEKADRISV